MYSIYYCIEAKSCCRVSWICRTAWTTFLWAWALWSTSSEYRFCIMVLAANSCWFLRFSSWIAMICIAFCKINRACSSLLRRISSSRFCSASMRACHSRKGCWAGCGVVHWFKKFRTGANSDSSAFPSRHSEMYLTFSMPNLSWILFAAKENKFCRN